MFETEQNRTLPGCSGNNSPTGDPPQLSRLRRSFLRNSGRGPSFSITRTETGLAIGMPSHGSPAAKFAQGASGLLPDRLAEKLMQRAGIDRLAALQEC